MWNLWFWSNRRKAKEGGGEEDDEEEEGKGCDCEHLLLPKASPINRYDSGGEERKGDLDLLDKIQTISMSLLAWMRNRRRRLLFLALCSPLLLFLLFAIFPVLFAARIFHCLCRRRQREETEQLLPPRRDILDPAGENDDLRCCNEDDRCDGEMRFLLQRYLEDQLTLVLGFVYRYGEELDLHEEDEEESHLRDIRASFDWPIENGDDEHFNFLCVNMES